MRELAKTSSSVLGRRHALDTLQGLDALEAEDITRALTDEDARLQRRALVVLSQNLRDADRSISVDEELASGLKSLAADANPQVAVALALTLRQLSGALRSELWQQLAATASLTPDLRAALLMGATENRVALIRGLATSSGGDRMRLMLDLTEMVGLANNAEEAAGVLAVVADEAGADAARSQVLTSLGRGLRRRSGSLMELVHSPAVSAGIREPIDRLMTESKTIASQTDRSDAERERAIGLLAHASFADAGPVLGELLTPQTSQRLQQAAIAALNQHPGVDAGGVLLENWESFSPGSRKAAVSAMLSQKVRTEALLQAMTAGTAKPGDLEPADRQLLLNHPDEAIRTLAGKVIGRPTSDDREEVIARYEPALESPVDFERGRAVYKKTCANCHRLGQEGHAVGPDLVSVKNKSARDLLIAILDPNRERQPNYASYSLVTAAGRVVTGIISGETADSVTLRQAEGKEETVLREDIEVLRANGVSLMPAGMEKDLSPEQVAAVIALIRDGNQ